MGAFSRRDILEFAIRDLLSGNNKDNDIGNVNVGNNNNPESSEAIVYNPFLYKYLNHRRRRRRR